MQQRTFGIRSLGVRISKFAMWSGIATAWAPGIILGLIFSLGSELRAQSQPIAIGERTTKIALADDYGDLSIESLLNKVYLAYGGKDAITRVVAGSLVLGERKNLAPPADGATTDATGGTLTTGTSVTEGSPQKFRHLRKGRSLRIDLETPGGWITTGYDGYIGWKSEGKVLTDLSAEATNLLSLEGDRDATVINNLGDADYKFKLLGRTVHRAIPCYAISVEKSDHPVCTVFVDQKNYLVVGVQYKSTDPETKQSAEISIEYEEYRPASGTLFPFKQVQLVNGTAVLETTVQTFEVQTNVDDEQFRRPDRASDVRLEKPVVMPFGYTNNEILVKASVNDGEPLDFLLDTGASQTLIDRRLAAENLLEQNSNYQMRAASGLIVGQTTTLKKISLGSVSIPEVQAVIYDLSAHIQQFGRPIAGIIGNNLLQKFALNIDYGKSQITLHDAQTFRAAAGAATIPFSQKKGPVIKGLVNGKDEVQFLVDTGSAFNNLPLDIAKKNMGTQTAHFTEAYGADGRSVRLGTLKIASLKLGQSSVKDIPFTYSTDPNQNLGRRGFVGGTAIGILGNPFWQNFNITIDYRMRQLALQANPTLASKQELEQLIQSGDAKLHIYREFRTAESLYQSALSKVQYLGDPQQQARVWGRLGNLRRVMAKDLGRPEQEKVAYQYFSKARELAHKTGAREIEGRILADWALLYMDHNQMQEAKQALVEALALAPQDAQVNVDFAVYLYKLRFMGEMKRYIDKALFLEPSNWLALWYKLKLTESFNDVEQSKQVLKDIIRFYPWSKLARDKLSAISQPLNQPGQTSQAGSGKGANSTNDN